MKVLLYFEAETLIKTSGIGRAFDHQKRALSSAGVEYTTDPWDDDYDILHINTVYFNSESIISHARKLGKKVIYHAHSTEQDFKNSFVFSNLMSPIWRRTLVNLYSRADALITPTPYSRSLIKEYGINLPIYPVSNGVDLALYSPDEEKKKSFQKYFHLSDNDKVVLGVGLPFERKGIHDFVRVAELLPEYQFIWFGEINMMGVPARINEIIENHPPNCRFPGYVKGPIIQGAYQAADVFFFPSYEETEGIVVLEALAGGQQVIVRDIGVFEPWLKNGRACYKGVSNGEFVNLIRGCIEHTLPSTAEEGYRIAKKRSIETVGRQLKRVYEAVLEGRILEDAELEAISEEEP
ncbi:MAG: glycosyltransferase [Solobacterium sp.]|nr:glycosyltransferase [Solobacterium sp.]